MRTALECLPCFLKQTLYTARLATASTEQHQRIMHAISRLLPDLDLERTPPENSMPVYETIARLSGCPDPFRRLKDESNRLALAQAPGLAAIIAQAADPLFTAFKLAIAGNIIDYGAHHDFDLDQALADSLTREPALFEYARFREDLAAASSILYLGDNCGELVFDRLAIRELGCRVTLAVKEKPIINDALIEDALSCGLGEHAEIIANGTACPGTPLPLCSPEFQHAFAKADLIISKGQGNFETLSETRAPIYFLLTVKCPVVAGHAAQLRGLPAERITTGDMLFMRTPHWQKHFSFPPY